MSAKEDRGSDGWLWLLIVLFIFGPAIGNVLPRSAVPPPVCPSTPLGPFVCVPILMTWVVESYWWLILGMMGVLLMVHWAIVHFTSRVKKEEAET